MKPRVQPPLERFHTYTNNQQTFPHIVSLDLGAIRKGEGGGSGPVHLESGCGWIQ